jgi:hypothetical protein
MNPENDAANDCAASAERGCGCMNDIAGTPQGLCGRDVPAAGGAGQSEAC